MRADFVALDKLTLAEIEQLFSERVSQVPNGHYSLPSRVRRQVGRSYLTVPGAVFFELEDLLESVAK